MGKNSTFTGWLVNLFGDTFFGTGDSLYEEKIGRMERRILKSCRRIRHEITWAYARSASLSAREMDHWLFLNVHSLFRQHLEVLTPEVARNSFTGWLALCITALSADPGITPLPGDGWATLRQVISNSDSEDAARWEQLLNRCRSQLGSRELYQFLLDQLSVAFPAKPNLEETLTFGILANQMLVAATSRCHHFLPRS